MSRTFKGRIVRNPNSGELGAAAYPVNVTGNVFSPSGNLNNLLKDSLIRWGWGVTSLSITSRGAGVFTVHIKMNAIRNTEAELRRIETLMAKDMSELGGLGVTLKATFANSFPAIAPMPVNVNSVSQFTFTVSNINIAFDLKTVHAKFNQKVVAKFPKILYSGAFSSYSNAVASGLYSSGFITASGETKLSYSETRQALINLLTESGFVNVDRARIEFDQKTVGQIQQGQQLQQPTAILPVRNTNALGNGDGLPTGNGLPFALPDFNGDFLGNLGTALGVSVPVVLAGLFVLGIIVLRK